MEGIEEAGNALEAGEAAISRAEQMFNSQNAVRTGAATARTVRSSKATGCGSSGALLSDRSQAARFSSTWAAGSSSSSAGSSSKDKDVSQQV